jgi:hypothetical protein
LKIQRFKRVNKSEYRAPLKEASETLKNRKQFTFSRVKLNELQILLRQKKRIIADNKIYSRFVSLRMVEIEVNFAVKKGAHAEITSNAFLFVKNNRRTITDNYNVMQTFHRHNKTSQPSNMKIMGRDSYPSKLIAESCHYSVIIRDIHEQHVLAWKFIFGISFTTLFNAFRWHSLRRRLAYDVNDDISLSSWKSLFRS